MGRNELGQGGNVEQLIQVCLGEGFLPGILILGVGFLQLLPAGVDLLLAAVQLCLHAFQCRFAVDQLGVPAAEARCRRHFALFQLGVGVAQHLHVALSGILRRLKLVELVGQGGQLVPQFAHPGMDLLQVGEAFLREGEQISQLLLGEGDRRRRGQRQAGVRGGGSGFPVRCRGCGGCRRGLRSGDAALQLSQIGVDLIQESLEGLLAAQDGIDVGAHFGQQIADFLVLGLTAVQIAVELILQGLLQALQRFQLGGQGGHLGHRLIQLLAGLGQLGRGRLLLVGQLLLAFLQGIFLIVQLGLTGDQGFLAVIELAAGVVQLLLGLGQTVADLHQKPVVHLVDLVLVQAHLHHLLHQTGGGDAGHAAHAFQIGDNTLLHIGGKVIDVQPLLVHRDVLGGHHVGSDLQKHGGAGGIGQGVGQLVQRRARLDHGAVHIGIIGKFQHDHAVVLAAGAGDVLHAVDRAQTALQRAGQLLLHLLGTGPGIGGHHHQIGQGDAGQQVGVHTHQADHTQHKYKNDPHQHGEGLFHTVFCHR